MSTGLNLGIFNRLFPVGIFRGSDAGSTLHIYSERGEGLVSASSPNFSRPIFFPWRASSVTAVMAEGLNLASAFRNDDDGVTEVVPDGGLVSAVQLDFLSHQQNR